MSFFIKTLIIVIPLLSACSSSLPLTKRGAEAAASSATVWSQSLRSDSLKNGYRVSIKTPKTSITGLCIVKRSGGELRGSLINEMGAKAFDFVVTDANCQLLNIIPALDKWYIRKTLADDLFFLFGVDNPSAAFAGKAERFEQNDCLIVTYGKKQIIRKADGSVSMTNSRRRLQYNLRKIPELDTNKLIL